ncbi:hypothetical protein AKJ08_1806 [Vulgatibacter incomptus]|uniref:DUF2760 domain-containing protein n=1 Tax=Vulgatibacter incomptus TaxID=1391653 RepID=A0A0K1PE64_9BACT|nr:hypothetical protein AKJ08_1806 [Vulgatibacter incomptus]
MPWKVLFDGLAASLVQKSLERGEVPALPAPAPAPKAPEAPRVVEPKAPSKEEQAASALQLLAILQRDGRFVDFLQEEIAAASDDQVGAAARIVHEGCRKALAQYVRFAPIRDEEEGAAVTVPAGFDAARVRLTGNVTGQPPFRGRLAHPGWKATEVRFPTLAAGHEATVIAPAEVEL